jgi:tRNA threonylcarbamoyladenosine biosynthesis protein TsaB
MLLLIIDTAGATGGVLLARFDTDIGDAEQSYGEQIVAVRELHPRAFSAELIPAIAELLHENHLNLADVDGFAAVSGPGSFTGLRVGLSAVKALAEACAKPILTVSRLAILASLAAPVMPPELADTVVHAVLDAGRGEFYHGIYRNAGKTCVAEAFETLPTLTASLQASRGVVVAFEPAVWKALATIDGLDGLDVREIPGITVRDAFPLALAAWHAGNFQDPAVVDANYLRRSDAIVVANLKVNLSTAGQPVAKQKQELQRREP